MKQLVNPNKQSRKDLLDLVCSFLCGADEVLTKGEEVATDLISPFLEHCMMFLANREYFQLWGTHLLLRQVLLSVNCSDCQEISFFFFAQTKYSEIFSF